MKIIPTLVVIFLLMGLVTVYGQEVHKEHIPIDFEAIKLKPPFTQQRETQQVFWGISTKFGRSRNRRHLLYDEAFMTEMITFIAQHPSDTAALTIKYYLAEYLLFSWFMFELDLDPELLSMILTDMLTVYQDIASEAPDTWQGKLASHFTLEYFLAMLDKDEVYREKRRAMWPLLLEIKDEEDFRFLWMYKGHSEPVEVTISAERIWFALEEGNFAAAEEEFAILREHYPDLPKTHQAERSIASAYERQFEGGLHALPKVKLRDILTTSQDPLKVKQAAAALGNREIWGTLRPPDWLLQTINETVLSYIEQAVSGTPEEQEEAIDLLYRLWHLAVPMLLQTLDHDDPAYVELAADLLVYMRDEEIISTIIEKARSTEDEQQKARLIALLSRMNEPCVPVMRFRECLDDEQAEELYQRFVVPALEELKAQ